MTCPYCHKVRNLTLEDISKLMSCQKDAAWIKSFLDRYQLVHICEPSWNCE